MRRSRSAYTSLIRGAGDFRDRRGSCRRADDLDAPVVDDEVLDGGIEVVGGDVQDRRPDLVCRLAGGPSSTRRAG
jgi:hypothetical protein